ncbi:MAG: 50S ribosomal protein L11 methyltransferase [Alcanivoracaceae bacterium]
MPWQQLHMVTASQRAERLQSLLERFGACAVTLTDAADQPLFEPPPGETPLWDQTVVSALFEQHQPLAPVLAQLEQAWEGPLPAHQVEQLEDQTWERVWMDDFAPMRFGSRLWIIPGGHESKGGDAVNLMLDPGLAFGTGTHETTALCLEWLDGASLAGKQVLDFGCGSGVLAIAALLLGAERAVCCDIDPQALIATRDNAGRNGVLDRVQTCLPADMPAAQHYDLVVANILAGPLQELSPTLTGFCRPGGELVLSGILASQAEDVASCYRKTFTMEPMAQRGDWVRLSGTRRS